MLNLLSYINPSHKFDPAYNDDRMVETQIDNSLKFAKPEDILFTTNFPYEYHGIKSMVVPDELFSNADSTHKASKVNVIIYLLESGLLPALTWYRDLDAFQLEPIDLKLERDIALASYGYKASWNTGVIFFKPAAIDIFKLLKDEVERRKANEEPVLWILTKHNINGITSRIQALNSTHNVGMTRTDVVLSVAEKPIKVAHFPPHRRDVFEMFRPILTKNLISLINEKYKYQ